MSQDNEDISQDDLSVEDLTFIQSDSVNGEAAHAAKQTAQVSSWIYREKPLSALTPTLWVALACLIFLTLSAIVWAFVGSIPIYVEGKGIFMSYEGGFTVQALNDGIVQELFVKQGDRIKKGDLLANIFNPKEELSFKASEIKVANLIRDYAILQKEIEIEAQANKESIESELAAKNFSIQQKQLNLTSQKEDLEKKHSLFKEGLISASVLRDEDAKFIQGNIDLETEKAAVVGLKTKLAKSYRTDDLKLKEQELFKAQEERDLLKNNLQFSKIYAPANGHVLEVYVNTGDLVVPGKTLIWLEHLINPDNPLEVYGYFDVDSAKGLYIGQKVKINTIKVSIPGVIREISQYAISSDTISRIFHSSAFEQFLTGGAKAVLSVRITPELSSIEELEIDIEDPSSEISTGTVCTIQALAKRIKPIYILIPLTRFEESSAKL